MESRDQTTWRRVMIERKWKPENHKLEDAFFPVELCDLKFVYPAETDLFGKVVCVEYVIAKDCKRERC